MNADIHPFLRQEFKDQPCVIIHHCVIYFNPEDDPVISNQQEYDPILRVQHVPGMLPWFCVDNNELVPDEFQPRGCIRIRPMTREEIADHDARMLGQADA